MPTSLSKEELQQAGLREHGASYTYTESDVHPELGWAKRRRQWGKSFRAPPEQQLTEKGFYANIANEAVAAGLDKTKIEEKASGLTRAMTTQGGKGVHGTEFGEECPGSRGMPAYTHQFKARMRTLHEAWDVARWDDKFESIVRVFTFDNPRYPYFLYNRLNDRVIVEDQHYPIEMLIRGKTLTVYLTTTYSQCVSEFDFLLAAFLDKEYHLMSRPDWTPVVRKTLSSGAQSFCFETPEAVDVSALPQEKLDAPLRHFLGGLQGDWEVAGATLRLSQILNSWSRVMDLVNSLLETCEAAGVYPDEVRVNVDTVHISLADGAAGRLVATIVDALVVHHAAYLAEKWTKYARQAHGDYLNRTKEHLADMKPEPTGQFLKNPLGKGMGPIRKVMFEKPADEEAFEKQVAWGNPSAEESRRVGQARRLASTDDPVLDSGRAEMRQYQHRPNVIERLQGDLQNSERMKSAPALE